MRQMMAGKISSQTTSSIFNPIVGVQFTNTPTTYRRSFGTYTLSDVTEPNWIVELYVNSVLVDYVKADASGFYKFEVPLVYGNSAVMLRFYGPWGEERTKEENISIPFNFLPANEFEYTLSAGIVEDTLNSRFSRATLNYGLSKRLTIGGGIEYLSSVTTGTTMPFLTTSLRLASSLLLSGEYTYGVRYKGILSYRLPSNMQFELDYAHYQKGQKAIIYNYLEERKAVISLPIKANNFAAFTRLTLNQIVMENLKNTNAELLLSGAVYGVSTNFTTYGLFTDPSNPYIYSNLSLAFRLPKKITFTPQIQYEYILNDFIATKFNLEKPLFKNGFLNISYEQNFKSNITNVELGLRYDFPFAQTGFSARQSNDVSSFVQSARGSLMYDPKTNFLGTTNRTSVGKGGIIFLPFLDLNCNGHRDPDEPKVPGLNLRLDGGRIEKNDKDTTLRVFDLIPYTNYFVELNKNSFENISWQIKTLTMNITVDPNLFKVIEVPIAVMGETSGTVYFKGIHEKKGQGQILINFYSNDSKLAARTMSENDGYFSFLGLAPGQYKARIDSVQLVKIHMTATPSIIPITVKRTKDGDVIDGLEFTLQSTLKDTTSVKSPVPEKKIVPIPLKEDTMGKALGTRDSTKVEKTIPVARPAKDSILLKKSDSAKVEKAAPANIALKDSILLKKLDSANVKKATPAISAPKDSILLKKSNNTKVETVTPAIVVPKDSILLKKLDSAKVKKATPAIMAPKDSTLLKTKESAKVEKATPAIVVPKDALLLKKLDSAKVKKATPAISAPKDSILLKKSDNTKVEMATPAIVVPKDASILKDLDSAKVKTATPAIMAPKDSTLLKTKESAKVEKVTPAIVVPKDALLLKKLDSAKVKKATPVIRAPKDSILLKKPVDKIAPVEKPAQTAKAISESGTQIQVGAFLKTQNASAALHNLEKIVGRKCLVVFEEGYYKVRVAGFKDRIEGASYIPKLVAGGFTEAFVVVYHQGLVIQVDAFIHLVNALAVQKKLILATGRPVVITFEGGFYKVRIGGFSGRKEAESFLPKLIEKGYPDAFIIRD